MKGFGGNAGNPAKDNHSPRHLPGQTFSYFYCWLLRQTGNQADTDDLIQEIFLRALRQQRKFCAIVNTRAWLFEVARHLVIDKNRRRRAYQPLHEGIYIPDNVTETVDSFADCLHRILNKMTEADRTILTLCDLEGMKQADFADRKGLTLAATKSRLLRAVQGVPVAKQPSGLYGRSLMSVASLFSLKKWSNYLK
ncbi:sigma-70 family RNA polymerase sigma factor [Salmonella enterica]|nr:sigma-70 family RNA polymerase sigma factor [Salmonella enterica]